MAIFVGIFIGNCQKPGFLGTQQWCKHEPDGVSENKGYKIPDYVGIYNSVWYKIEVRRPDIFVIDKTKKYVKIVDVAIPGDEWVNARKVGRIEKYKVLNDEIARMWGMKEVIAVL